MSPSPLMARASAAQPRESRKRPICCLFAPITARKSCSKCASRRKRTRIPIAQQVLPCLPVAGRVYTADAMHTQVDFMALVHAWQGEAVLTVKANQPTLYDDLATYFADPEASYRTGQHHRLPTRAQRGAQYQGQRRAQRLPLDHLAPYCPGRPTHPHRHRAPHAHNSPRKSSI